MPSNGPSYNPFPKGQCTWWAFQRYQQLTGKSVAWSGDAWSWGNGAKSAGWSVSSRPPPNGIPAIAVLQPNVQGAGSLGHVAVVESSSAGSVQTSNLNWAGNQTTPTSVTFRPGAGVSFVWYTGAKKLPNVPPVVTRPTAPTGTTPTPTPTPGSMQLPGEAGPNLIGVDLSTIWTSAQDILTGSIPGTYIPLLDQVHLTLTTNPGFYGIALAVDEAEQFPGWIDLTRGPVDVTGYLRSVGASFTDNFLPIMIRGNLVGLGTLIIVLLLVRVIMGAVDKVMPLIETVGALA